MLVAATLCWAVSFPLMRALSLHQPALVPGAGSWFFSSVGVTVRFWAAGLCLGLLCFRKLPGLTRLEIEQGVGLGVFGALGMLFQMDGLAHTDASVSAFLTQGYVLLLPLWQAAAERRPPPPRLWLAVAAVVVGVAILSGVSWDRLRLGRGEIETIIASGFFTGQILWLQRPRYEPNHVKRFSVVMFGVMGLTMLPVVALTAPGAAACFQAFASLPALGMTLLLVGICTLGGYLLMNHWQRHLGATEAGLIYCTEPVFASLLALWLPAWLSRWVEIDYPNETVTARLLLGGGLILAANLFVQWQSAAESCVESPAT